MSAEYDLVVRGGLVFDGNGNDGVIADVAVKGDRIAMVGQATGSGRTEIDAQGQIVTPGFVDIHTHYDGQVLWEDYTEPSSRHGVTTAVIGNCGVGFAPCRAEHREKLIELMEGVEDIPDVVMAEGLPWNWETFEEYLDVVEARKRDIDVAAQLPHACLRVYVMGERASYKEASTEADRAEMQRLAESAVRAGAVGFGTSRSLFHRDKHGTLIPTRDVAEAELLAIARGLAAGGPAVMEALFDFDNLESEFGMFRRISGETGLPVSFLLTQTTQYPDAWRNALDLVGKANADGIAIRGQVIGRPTGMVLGLDMSFNPFSLFPAYRKIADLPLAERVVEMRKPEVRAAILADRAEDTIFEALKVLGKFHDIYPLGDPPNYEPAREDSIAARAAAAGVSPLEFAYDALLENEGKASLFAPFVNFIDGNLDNALAMLRHPHTVPGLGDGGAHFGSICDAGVPTFMLAYWARDRDGERLSIAEVVKMLTADSATAVGLNDRGRIGPGYKADINVIDFANLRLHAPRARYDLPGGARRLVQQADGYSATVKNGVVTYRNGQPTGALPGGLVRGQQKAPAMV